MMISGRNLKYGIAIVVIIILGFACKSYHGIMENVISNKIAGLWYVVFWTLLFRFLLPKKHVYLTAGAVLLVTIILEFTQLISFGFLDTLRSYYLVRALIGSHFSWSDIPYYMAGSLFAIILIKLLERTYKKKKISN
jgi:hypothetical protein